MNEGTKERRKEGMDERTNERTNLGWDQLGIAPVAHTPSKGSMALEETN